MRVIYLCEQPRFPISRQLEIIKPEPGDKVYTEGVNGEGLDAARRVCRNGRAIVCAKGLRVLGNSPSEIAVKLKEAKDRAIEDAETGLRSDRDGAAMVLAAMSQIKGEKSIGKRASSMGRAGGLALAKKRRDDRMLETKAWKIWHDKKIPSNEMALALMPGWTEPTAYKRLPPAPKRKPGRK